MEQVEKAAAAEEKLKIPVKYLPHDWRALGMQKFGCKVSKIEKVVYGVTENQSIFDFFLDLAEQGFHAEQERLNRISKLAS